jgi:type IV pilus assembly protein PilE
MSTPSIADRRQSGFTLIEVLAAVTIVGILAATAYPSYTSYVQRVRIIDAISKLSEFRVRMEQWYQDNRTYLDGNACGVADPPTAASDPFTVTCTGASASSYKVTATGRSAKGMGGFVYSLTLDDKGPTRSTDGVPRGWAKSATCWTTRTDGTCG